MIVTIKTKSKKLTGAGIFEAMKMGLETEVYDDFHFDLIAHDQKRADIVANACNGTIISVVDHMTKIGRAHV